MKLGNFYGLTVPNIILLKEQFTDEDFTRAVTLLNNPVDKNYITKTKQEIGFFLKSLNAIPVTYVSVKSLPASLTDTSIIVKNGVIQGTSNPELVLAQLKRYMSEKVACYVCMPNRKVTLNVTLFNDVTSIDCIREVFQKAVTDYLEANVLQLSNLDVATNKIARSLLDRKGDTSMSVKKSNLVSTIAKAFGLKEEINCSFLFGNEQFILNENELKILYWFKQHQNTLEECYPYLVENSITSTQTVFSMSFRDLIFRRPGRLISEVSYLYKNANINLSNENLMGNIKNNIIKELETFNTLFKENVVSKNSVKKCEDFSVQTNPEDSRFANAFKIALRNRDMVIENCNSEKLETFVKLFEFTNKLTKEYYNELFGVNMSLEEWESTIAKLNSLGIAGIHFQTATVFVKSLKQYSFDDRIIIEKTEEEIAIYEKLLYEIYAFLDSQLPLGERIGVVDDNN